MIMSLSILNGVVARSTVSGRVIRGHIQAANHDGLLGAPPGNGVSSAAFTVDGSIIIWGRTTGEVRVVLIDRATNTDRSLASHALDPFHARHRGPVTQISCAPWPKAAVTSGRSSPTFFATASSHQIKIWRLTWQNENPTARGNHYRPSGECLWTHEMAEPSVVNSITALVFDPTFRTKYAFVATGHYDGTLSCWQLEFSPSRTAVMSELNCILPALPRTDDLLHSVDLLYADFEDVLNKASVLVHRSSDAFFTQEFPFSEDHPIYYQHLNEKHLAGITALTPDFESPNQRRPTVVKEAAAVNELEEQVLLDQEEAVHGFGTKKYVIAGDLHGRTYVWPWNVSSKHVHPSKQLQGMTSKVTVISITDLLVFVGNVDGVIRAYDPLTSRLVKNFQRVQRRAIQLDI